MLLCAVAQACEILLEPNWQLSIQIDFVPRLQTLQGITRSQRRDGEQLFKESQMRLQKQTKAKKKTNPKKKV